MEQISLTNLYSRIDEAKIGEHLDICCVGSELHLIPIKYCLRKNGYHVKGHYLYGSKLYKLYMCGEKTKEFKRCEWKVSNSNRKYKAQSDRQVEDDDYETENRHENEEEEYKSRAKMIEESAWNEHEEVLRNNIRRNPWLYPTLVKELYG